MAISLIICVQGYKKAFDNFLIISGLCDPRSIWESLMLAGAVLAKAKHMVTIIKM